MPMWLGVYAVCRLFMHMLLHCSIGPSVFTNYVKQQTF